MDTIETMRAFIAVARQRSFTEGARQLEMSTKLISKYVRQLEERLGAQLLHRTTRSVTLTETGEAYFTRCIALLEQFDELEGLVQLKTSELAGTIRITAPTGFGSTHLVDALSSFQQQHPNVVLQLQLSDHNIAIVEEGVDLAIRFGPLHDSSLIARKLMDMRLVVAVSGDYLKQHGTPADPQALASHNCLIRTSSSESQTTWQFNTDGQTNPVKVNGAFHSNNPKAIAQMAANGLGICRSPLYAVQPYLDDGRLQLLFEDQETHSMALYAVYPPSRHLTARVRTLIDHLQDSLE